MHIVCVASALLTLAIGFLLITQMMTILVNITTLESFTDGMEEDVIFL